MLRKSRICFIVFFIYVPFTLITGCKKKSNDLKIYFAGDLLLDRGVREQINKKGVARLFDGVRPLFKTADAVVANLECPVTKSNTPVNKKYIFRAEPEWLNDVRKAGITHLVMANNHTYDQGRNGIRETYDNLIKHDLIPIGYGNNQQNACSPVIIQKGAIKVALFSSVLLTLENWAYLPDSTGICQATAEELEENIRVFKTSNKDCKIVVILHWGVEFQEIPTVRQRQQAEGIIDAGADAIIGCHPHVVQSHSIYKGKPIFYSVGNFIFDQEYNAAKKGLLVELIFSDTGQAFTMQQINIKDCTPFP